MLAQVAAVEAVFEWLLVSVYGALLGWLAAQTGIEMLAYPFMQRAFLVAAGIGLIGPVVGTFLVHREIAMIGDTLAHTAFAGVAVGIFLNALLGWSLSPILTALVVAIIAAIAVEVLVEVGDTYTDTSLAIVLTGGFAVGSILITATEGGLAVGVNQYLFGSLTTVSRAQVGLLLIIAVIVLGLVAIAYRPLVYMTFDPTAAATARIDVRRYRRLVVMLTALVVVSAMQIMGVILVAGMLVIPVAAATVTAPSFRRSIAHAVAAGQLAAIGGVTLAYVFGIAAGGAVIIAAIAVYAVVLTADRLGA